MTSSDPREQFLRALKSELPNRPFARRRVIREVAEHLDDLIAELRAAGVPEGAAAHRALQRLGDPETIATAFSGLRPERPRWSRVRALRSPAWVAVAAMSLVTAWAAELPQASGANAPPRPASVLRPSSRLAQREVVGHAWRVKPRSPGRSRLDQGPRNALASH